MQRNSYVSYRRCGVAVAFFAIPDTPYVCKLTCKCVSVHVTLPVAKLHVHVPVYRLPAISQFHIAFLSQKNKKELWREKRSAI